jgi:hypothetical protein
LAAFTAAKSRWESIITTDIADVSSSDSAFLQCFEDGPEFPVIFDDIYICSQIEDLPFPVVGQAGPVELRGFGNFPAEDSPLPINGIMTFDPVFVSSPIFTDVVLHEMAHVLGIGTLWTTTSPPLADSDTPPCSYADGTLASVAYQTLSGCSDPVPLENDTGRAGSDCSHWAEGCFGTELMTPTISAPGVANPISVITIVGLEDLSYAVDMSQADPFDASQLDASCVCDSNNGQVTTPTEALTKEQEDAYLFAWDHGMAQLLSEPEGDAVSITGWISVVYMDPVTGAARSVIVKTGDR